MENDENKPETQVSIVPTYTEQDKEDFLKSVLSDEPFTAEYKLMNNQFNVKFRTLTVDESSAVFVQLRKDQTAGRVASDASYLLKLVGYRLGLSLVTINDAPFQTDITKESYKPTGDTDSYIRAKAAIFDNWPSFKLSLVADVFKDFEDKVLDLTKEIQSENFWIAAK